MAYFRPTYHDKWDHSWILLFNLKKFQHWRRSKYGQLHIKKEKKKEEKEKEEKKEKKEEEEEEKKKEKRRRRRRRRRR